MLTEQDVTQPDGERGFGVIGLHDGDVLVIMYRMLLSQKRLMELKGRIERVLEHRIRVLILDGVSNSVVLRHVSEGDVKDG